MKKRRSIAALELFKIATYKLGKLALVLWICSSIAGNRYIRSGFVKRNALIVKIRKSLPRLQDDASVIGILDSFKNRGKAAIEINDLPLCSEVVNCLF